MKKLISPLFAICILAFVATSCATSKSMRDSNTRLNLTPADMTISSTLSAEAKVVKVFGIDWKRLFKANSGNIEGGPSSFAIPVIGGFISDKSQGYALYELFNANQGYDCVVFPKFTTTNKNYIIFSKTVTKVEAKMGKIK